MFCHKCGNKSPEGAVFCQKCGAKLIQDGAAAQTTDKSVNVTTPLSVKTPTSPAATVSTAAQESSAPKSTAPMSESAAEIYNLLKANMSSCSAIKAVTQAKNGTVLKGTIRKYLIIIAASGQAVILSSLVFPFIILDWIAYGLIVMLASSIGWDFAEYGSIHFEDFALVFAICLLIGGLIKTITPFLGFKEKETISTYVSEVAKSKGIALAAGTVKTKVPAARLAVSIIPALIGAIILIFVMINNFGFGGGRDVPAATFEHSASSIVEKVSLSQTYTNEDEGFLFMYPGNWDVKEESTMVAVSAPAESGYSASIAIMKSDADETYFSATMSDFESLYSSGKDSFRMLDLSDITLSGHSARKLIYTYSDNRGSYTQVQYFYIVNSDMYFVTCSSLKEHFDKYAPVFDTIMDSYTIIATSASEKSGTSYKDIGADTTNSGPVNSMEEAQEIVEAWMLDHPMGTMAGVSTGAAVNDVDSISAEYFVLELWKSPREFAGLVYIRKSDGYITFKQFDSDVEISLDEWYNGTFGEADMVAGNGAKSIVEGEILYKGFPVTQFFNSTIDDAVNALGAPTYEGYYEGPAYVFNDEISFRFDDITREIAFIETRIPHVLEVNGIALGKYREEIINALGTPTHEITFYDEMENKNVYKMEYSLNEYGIVLSIQMPHPDGKVKLVVIRQDYQSDEEYQESSNNIDPSSPLTTADGNTLSVGSLVYAKQNVFGVSVNYVRGYVTAINDAGSVSVQWDTLLENRLWAYDECAILSDSSSPSGYSYYSSASGKQIPLAGVKFNLSANELYSKIP